jgi:hypothetical protein
MKATPHRPRPPSFADRFDQLRHVLDRLVTQQRALRAQIGTLMPVLADIQAKIATLTTAVAANTQVDGSIVTLLQGLTAMIAALKQQLADAIASNDPAALQAVLDGLGAAETAISANTQKLADAAVANTPV